MYHTWQNFEREREAWYPSVLCTEVFVMFVKSRNVTYVTCLLISSYFHFSLSSEGGGKNCGNVLLQRSQKKAGFHRWGILNRIKFFALSEIHSINKKIFNHFLYKCFNIAALFAIVVEYTELGWSSIYHIFYPPLTVTHWRKKGFTFRGVWGWDRCG